MFFKFVTKFILFLSLTVGSIWGQSFTNFFFNGNGANAAGMGNAYTAVAEDATAISWNPAALPIKKYPQASVIGRFGKSSVDINGFQDFGIDSWDISKDIYSQINYVGFTYPLNIRKIKTTIGIAYRRIYDFSYNEENSLKGPLFGSPSGSLISNSSSTGGIGAFALSGGFRLHKMFYIGTTLNYYTGVHKTHDTYTLNGEIEIDRSKSYKTDYRGFGIDFAMLVKPLKELSIGLNINVPHSLDSEGDTLKQTVKMPTFFTIGIAYRPTKRILFAFDYRPQPLSKIKIDDILSDKADMYSIHFGLEYKIRGGKKLYPLRFGYYKNSDSAIGMNADNAYTGGISFPFQNFSVDIGAEFARTEYDKKDETLAGDKYSAHIKSKDYRVTIGFAFQLVRR